jgi:hypothetical protein
MAKKGKKGFRIPKEIGGVKVPKEARRAGEALIEKVNTPAGRQALASGLAMAASAAAAVAAKQARGAARPSPAAAADAQPAGCHNNNPQQPGQGGTANLDQVAEAFGQAADAFMNKMFGRR